MCSGINAEAYKVLCDNKNLTYKCSGCLTKKSTAVTRNDYDQLAEMVRGVCKEMSKLIDGEKTVWPRMPSSRGQESKQPDEKAIRKMIRDETQDRVEREKRKEFLIVRGFEKEETDQECADIVSDVLEELAGRPVTYSDFLRFDNRLDLVRVKVLNDADRRTILSNAPNLRSSEKSRFFVRRDLTYLQRQVLKERYDQRKAANRDDNRAPPGRTTGSDEVRRDVANGNTLATAHNEKDSVQPTEDEADASKNE